MVFAHALVPMSACVLFTNKPLFATFSEPAMVWLPVPVTASVPARFKPPPLVKSVPLFPMFVMRFVLFISIDAEATAPAVRTCARVGVNPAAGVSHAHALPVQYEYSPAPHVAAFVETTTFPVVGLTVMPFPAVTLETFPVLFPPTQFVPFARQTATPRW